MGISSMLLSCINPAEMRIFSASLRTVIAASIVIFTGYVFGADASDQSLTRTILLQSSVLSFGLVIDGNVRVGVLPEVQKIFVGGNGS